MAAKTARRSARTAAAGAAARARAEKSTAAATEQTVDSALVEARRFVRAWTAAYNVSVRNWGELMRTSAEMTAQASQRFVDALK